MGLKSNPEQEVRFSQIARLIESAHSIAICAHTSPDGDALGSELALARIIEARWAGKQVACLLADDDPVPRIYRFMDDEARLIPASSYVKDPDLFISVDVSVPARLNQAQPVMQRARRVAIIDHHPCEQPFGNAWIIRPDAAAAGVIVTEFALYLGLSLDNYTARDLFCALCTDTGRFQYQNADPEAFAVASLLVDAGASPSEVSLNVYQNFSLAYLHLESVVMGRITTFESGRIAYSYATTADLERTGASLDEADGLVDVVRSVAGSEVALFLKEVGEGKVRGNLRSKTDRDVSAVARSLGGGGHRAAAGFTMEGDIDEVLSEVLPGLCALFGDDCEVSGLVSPDSTCSMPPLAVPEAPRPSTERTASDDDPAGSRA